MSKLQDIINSFDNTQKIVQNRTPEQDIKLLRKYAPILYFHPEERSWPSSVDWYLERTKLLKADDNTVVLNPVGSIKNLDNEDYRRSTYRLEILDPNTREGQKDALHDVRIYGYVIPYNNHLQIRYYFFYPFNGNIFDLEKMKKWLTAEIATASALGFLGFLNPLFLFSPYMVANAIALQQGISALDYLKNVKGLEMHEGDWEHITVLAELDESEIIAVYYAAHADEGQWALPLGSTDPYTPLRFNTENGRPIVFVAKESHASYPKVMTKSRLATFANDKTEKGIQWDTQSVIVNMNDNNQKWGESHILWGSKGKNPFPNSVLFGAIAQYGEYHDGPYIPSWNSLEEGSDRFTSNDPALSDKEKWNKQEYYKTIQCADIDGDGQAELIARYQNGIRAWKCNPLTRRWDELPNGPGMSDQEGWAWPPYYETIQCADIDGDGKAELIARSASCIVAFKYDPSKKQWNGLPDGPDLSDKGNWKKPEYYKTIQCADIDGDGRAELIARSSYGILAWKFDPVKGWIELPNGPGMSDQEGWAWPPYYETIQCADIDGDGKAELIARSASCIVAFKYDPSKKQWNGLPDGPDLSDKDNWKKPEYYKTIQCANIDKNASGSELIARGPFGILTFWWTYT